MSDKIKKVSQEEIEQVYSVKNRALPPKFIKQANEINILDYLEKKGILTKNIGGGQFELIDHDSFKINADPSSKDFNKFNWMSRGEGGFGPVGFAKVYFGMNFREAVRDVLENADEMIERVKPIEKRVNNEKPYEYDKSYMTKDTRKIENYLVNERNINPDLVEALIDKGMIRQTQKFIETSNGKSMEVNNVAFMWQRHGKIIGHDERGIAEGSHFKKIASGVPENRGFSVTFGKPKNLFVFESNIDALSYASLYRTKDSRFISMNGVEKTNTVYQAIKDIMDDTNEIPENIVLCLDNDKAGLETTKKLSVPLQLGEKTIEFYISQPPRFQKDRVVEKNDINQLFKTIDNKDFKENDLKIECDDINIFKGETGWKIVKDDKEYTVNDDKTNRNIIRKHFEKNEFTVTYTNVTKDWNEVLSHVKENKISLERPLEKPKFVTLDERENNKKIENSKDKGIER